MAKSNASKKRKAAANGIPGVPAKKLATISTEEVQEEDEMVGGVLFQDELDLTLQTLRTITSSPSLLKLKQLKGFKSALHEVWRVNAEESGTGSSITSRISSALSDGRHLDALVLLSEMRLRNLSPRLGSLQRWVRECDATALESMRGKGKGKEAESQRVWEVLDSILRTCWEPETSDGAADMGIVAEDVAPGRKGVRKYSEFKVGECSSPSTYADWKSGTLLSSKARENYLSLAPELERTPGPERRPPNLHPAVIYHSPASPPFDFVEPLTPATSTPMPGIPGAFVLSSILSPSECRSMVEMAEAIGMHPDQPVAGSAVDLNSVLAHNIIYLASPEMLDVYFSRVKHLLPERNMKGDGKLAGLNARFRIYRYSPGALYRPHVDGAWPASSSIPATETSPAKYVYDSDPNLYSRYTLLIYLNDSFEGGHTTFFVPDREREGVLNALPVKPVCGNACVFPHGRAMGSLLHEGSGVTEGAKWVIRTEVLYECERTPAEGGAEVGGLV